MGITNTRLNLENNVARYKGERETSLAEIERIEAGLASLPALKERVAHLDTLIAAAELLVREDNPEWSADDVQPRQKTSYHSPIPFGSLGRTALEILRDGPPEGMHTRDIARELLRQFKLDSSDRKLLDKTTNSLGTYLKSNEGDLVRSDGERYYKRWRPIRPMSE